METLETPLDPAAIADDVTLYDNDITPALAADDNIDEVDDEREHTNAPDDAVDKLEDCEGAASSVSLNCNCTHADASPDTELQLQESEVPVNNEEGVNEMEEYNELSQ